MIKKCRQLGIFSAQKLIFRLVFLGFFGFLIFGIVSKYFISLLHKLINFRTLNSAAFLLNLSVEIYGKFVFVRFIVVEVD